MPGLDLLFAIENTFNIEPNREMMNSMPNWRFEDSQMSKSSSISVQFDFQMFDFDFKELQRLSKFQSSSNCVGINSSCRCQIGQSGRLGQIQLHYYSIETTL